MRRSGAAITRIPAMTQLPAMLNLLIPMFGTVVLLVFSLRRVPEGEARLVNRFGRYHRTLKPGWRLCVPLLDRDGGRYPLLGHHVEVHLPQVQSSLQLQAVQQPVRHHLRHRRRREPPWPLRQRVAETADDQ